MSRTKGSPKTGGRKVGTPNKVTGTLKDWMTDLLDRNRAQIEKDLKALSHKDRLQILEKFMQYIVPKQKTELEIVTQSPIDDFDKIDLSSLPTELMFQLTDYLQDERYKQIMKEKKDIIER